MANDNEADMKVRIIIKSALRHCNTNLHFLYICHFDPVDAPIGATKEPTFYIYIADYPMCP